jgi:ABC-2 type transport system permease protein
MRTLIFLLQKEFLQIFRNKVILRIIVVLPIIQLLILPMAADYEIKNIRLSVVDHDRSTYSRQLINDIVASGYFSINDYSATFDQSFEEFQKDHSDLILEIPARFETDIVQQKGAEVLIALNAINGVKAMVGNTYLSRIIGAFNADIRFRDMPAPRYPALATIETVPQFWYNPNMEYAIFMVPGILVMLVTSVAAFMCAINIVKEKEAGTIEQINVTPIRKHYFILGKLIPFWVLSMFVFTLGLLGVARLVYGIVPVGSLLTLYGFLSVYLVAMLGIGLIISTYSATQQQSMSLAFFFMMIFMLMSGLFTPVDSMPQWAQWIARANPVTYFIEVVRLVVLKGSSLYDIRGHFLIISGMAVFFNAWAIWNYRKTS